MTGFIKRIIQQEKLEMQGRAWKAFPAQGPRKLRQQDNFAMFSKVKDESMSAVMRGTGSGEMSHLYSRMVFQVNRNDQRWFAQRCEPLIFS